MVDYAVAHEPEQHARPPGARHAQPEPRFRRSSRRPASSRRGANDHRQDKEGAVMSRSRGRVAGFTIIEMLVATMIMVAVTGAVFTLLNPSQGINQAQPEVSDVQQRMRVGVDTLTKDLIMAGAGSYIGSSAGALYNQFAPIMPYRSGDLTADPPNLFYRSDTISLMYVPPSAAQTGVLQNI